MSGDLELVGLHKDMPAETYHGIQAMSAGGLKRMRRSPAHFFGMQLDPNRPPPGEPTPAMKAGTLMHTCIFEPDQVAARYIVAPEGVDYRTKAGKDWKAATQAAHPGVEIIDTTQMAVAQAQARNIRALPEVASLLADGYGESSAFWIDEATGELCKCRPDWTSPAGDGVILVDGKSTVDASPDGFSRVIWNMDYALQAAWYVDGFQAATGLKVHGFVFAAAESAWPHAAAAYMLDDDVLDWARRKNRELLNRYAECKKSGQWPAYDTSIQLIAMPAWAMKEIAE